MRRAFLIISVTALMATGMSFGPISDQRDDGDQGDLGPGEIEHGAVVAGPPVERVCRRSRRRRADAAGAVASAVGGSRHVLLRRSAVGPAAPVSAAAADGGSTSRSSRRGRSRRSRRPNWARKAGVVPHRVGRPGDFARARGRDEAGFQQRVQRLLGQAGAADLLDLRPRDRLVVGDDGQRLHRRARQPARQLR